MADLNLRSRMTNLLLVIPNLLLLSARLMVDPRVPTKERLLVAGAIAYAFVPFDFIPDMLPFVGQVDDAYLIALTLLRLMSVTEPRVVREHWRGGGDVVELIGATALIAGRLLPRRIRRVLTGPVYMTFDIDAVDPAFAPGTGTPEVGGLTSHEAQQLVRGLAGLPLVGGDVVEVAPPFDGPGQITALLAANLMFEFLCALAVHRE